MCFQNGKEQINGIATSRHCPGGVSRWRDGNHRDIATSPSRSLATAERAPSRHRETLPGQCRDVAMVPKAHIMSANTSIIASPKKLPATIGRSLLIINM